MDSPDECPVQVRRACASAGHGVGRVHLEANADASRGTNRAWGCPDYIWGLMMRRPCATAGYGDAGAPYRSQYGHIHVHHTGHGDARPTFYWGLG